MGWAWQSGDGAGRSAALEAAGTSLAYHAQRAPPERDRQTGRSQLGLEPLFGSDQVIEFAEAASVLTYDSVYIYAFKVVASIFISLERFSHGRWSTLFAHTLIMRSSLV